MTPATILYPQGKDVEPWNRVGVHSFDVDPYSDGADLFYYDPYSDGADLFYYLQLEIEQVLGGNLRYVLRRFM